MNDELLSREGRLKKDQADFWLSQPAEKNAAEVAKNLYVEAARWYERAACVSGGAYYPLINQATCLWLAGDYEKACHVAEDVLQRVEVERQVLGTPTLENEADLMWLEATKGEALVIAGKYGWKREAETAYQKALAIARRRREPKHRSGTMVDQLRRIFVVMTRSPRRDGQEKLRELIDELAKLE
jgi:hypothetical protein